VDFLARATAIIEHAETDLRDLLAEAAHSGDYHTVVRIAAWARTMHDLRNAADKAGESGGNTDHPRTRTATQPRTRGPEDRKSGSAPRHKESEYPKFFRRKDELIRLAWSKREKKEYNHKASYAVLRALANAMKERGAGGRVFSTDELLPLRSEADGSDVPNYQAYVGIALLKQTGLIDQHGRKGYSIPRFEEFETAVENVWKQLPSH
jgi:hypothetical protein